MKKLKKLELKNLKCYREHHWPNVSRMKTNEVFYVHMLSCVAVVVELFICKNKDKTNSYFLM